MKTRRAAAEKTPRKWRGGAPSNLALIKYMGKAGQPQAAPGGRSPWPPRQAKAGGRETAGLPLLNPSRPMPWPLRNLPLNPSLSFSLNHLTSLTEIEEHKKKEDRWEPFSQNPFAGRALPSFNGQLPPEPPLSLDEQKKFLSFFQFLKTELSIPGSYTLRSENNFPRAAGAASSASSFAALTRAAFALARACSSDREKIKAWEAEGEAELSRLSRMGSGSSCRSFFPSWAVWRGQRAEALPLPKDSVWSRLIHQLVIAETKPKPVSSREAHARAETSPLFPGRKERAEKRLEALLSAMRAMEESRPAGPPALNPRRKKTPAAKAGRAKSRGLNESEKAAACWKRAFSIAWEEMEDLFSLFETASPPIRYRTAGSRDILRRAKAIWKSRGDGPLVTMDAGANVHLLLRPDQKKLAAEIKLLFSDYIVLSPAGLPPRGIKGKPAFLAGPGQRLIT